MIQVIVNVIKNLSLILVAAAFSLIANGCQPKIQKIDPNILLVPAARNVDCLASAFPKLTESELLMDYGKELQIAITFAKDFDLYRAITGYKRALILIPKSKLERIQQIEYSIIESYYLGLKYQEVIDTFEHSHLLDVRPDFPAIGQLLVILYDSYLQLGLDEKACRLLGIIEKGNCDIARKLKGYVAFSNADFMEIQNLGFSDNFLIPYNLETKSIKKAKVLNAVIPGAGYYYIGQKKSAITSFIINTLFTAAAYQFFHKGYYAAGAITASFEAGWYFGGINGAGLEAKEYNERLYECRAKDFMLKEKLFPILTFETSF
jgi:hypothetical protein